MAATSRPDLTKNFMTQLPLDEKAQPEFGRIVATAAADEVQPSELIETARSQSRGWVLEGKSAENKALEAELKKFVKLMRQVEKPGSHEGGSLVLPKTLQLLIASARMLLQSAITTADESLRRRLPLPELSLPDGQILPRCYVAAKAYLAATDNNFEEETFRDFIQGIQENGTLEMGELWQLSPMLQLDLLIQLGDKLRRASTQEEQVSEDKVERILSTIDRVKKGAWKNTFQILSVTDGILRGDASGTYGQMDFRSCDSYRDAVEQLARYSEKPEEVIAQAAVKLGAAALLKFSAGSRLAQRHVHVGYYLVDKGRMLLEREIGYHPQGMAFVRAVLLEAPELFYFLGVEFCLFAIMLFILSGIKVGVPFIAATLLFLLPVSEAAIEVINPFILSILPPRVLPRMDFSNGIPDDCLTVVAVPTLLISKEQVQDLVRTLEIRYLGNTDPNLCYALLTDPPDSTMPFDEKDQLVEICAGLIQGMNRKYGKEGSGPFFHLHRNRTFNETDQTWMGWERKRGKLLDFNEFLRGGEDKFPVKVGNVPLLKKARYVITLDSDTQLPRDSARRLVAAMAHPLNQALIDPQTNTVREGYGVLQPRVGISVNSVHRSRLAFIYSGQTGLDIYTNAVSDVYQDLFSEGIFTGKGIYEVDVFRRVLGGRFPSNAILSHDLIEGAYSRTGLVTEVEIIDDYPSHFSAHSRRKHRWVRGDWQILRWLLPKVPDAKNEVVNNPLGFLSRWKILDNLRRSVIEAATFLLFLACWFVLPGSTARWTIAALALLLIPSWVQGLLALFPVWKSNNKWAGVQQALDGFVSSQINVLVFVIFLPHQALVTLDAIIRTVFRLSISRRKLLEWETAAQSEVEKKRKTPVDIYLQLTPVLSVLIAVALYYFRPSALLVASPILLLWFFSRTAAKWLDRPLRPARSVLKDKDEKYARTVALKTWRYFREFSYEEQNWLIPDNIQGEDEVVASRISTTNLGMLFNVQYAAYHLGILTLPSFATSVERTMATTKKLERVHGQLVNWYDTKTLTPLKPMFISSVDNGNLACCLWTLKQGCLAAGKEPLFPSSLLHAIVDHLDLAALAMRREGWDPEATTQIEKASRGASELCGDVRLWILAVTNISGMVGVILRDKAATGSADAAWWLREAQAKIRDLIGLAEEVAPWVLGADSPAFRGNHALYESEFLGTLTLQNYRERITALQADVETRERELVLEGWHEQFRKVDELRRRLEAIASEANALTDEMNFRLFYDEGRKALSVGYDVGQGRLQASCYDLLASEARSAVFVAIAKNEIPQEAWFHMGRTHTRYARRNVLVSWTGTMFEYLMPALWLKFFPSTMLENSLRGTVACQKAYVRKYKIPWGISEGACSARNDSGDYEYHAFGVAPLALKATLPHKIVITPYASALALSTNPREALDNLLAMDALGWNGRYGFYESAEYEKSNLVHEASFQIVHSWMAHHQGMIMLSLCNLLSNGIFQRLFHDEVRVAATERILHELPLSPQALQLLAHSPAETEVASA
jgi:cyclic beta-1,2-glucan synthetase